MHKQSFLLLFILFCIVTESHTNPPVKTSHVVGAPTVVDIYDGGSPALPLETQNMWLEKAQDFLNGINTLKAKFVQVTSHPNGVMDSRTGMLKWMRPGYIRFDYDGLPFLQVAADGESFRQKDQDGISMSVSIDSTPAGLILKNNLNFRKDAVVKQVLDKDAFVLITLTSKDDPEGAALIWETTTVVHVSCLCWSWHTARCSPKNPQGACRSRHQPGKHAQVHCWPRVNLHQRAHRGCRRQLDIRRPP
ncbi:MAG: outer membrane lipoprotein carrier protein LolA, partial [Alphaproteobacteria bacterium]|nr:outer membrane lipoprotein carrier protein LolA [Alphaproteobacteria bacterium]